MGAVELVAFPLGERLRSRSLASVSLSLVCGVGSTPGGTSGTAGVSALVVGCSGWSAFSSDDEDESALLGLLESLGRGSELGESVEDGACTWRTTR